MEPMCRHPRLKRRGAVYYFRCKIPADLIAHYGTKEITKSLGTTVPADALLLVRQVSAQQDQEFERIRAAQRVTTLTDEQIESAAQAHLVTVLAADEIQRTRGLTLDALEAKEAGVEEADDMLREAYAVGDISPVVHLVDLEVQRSGHTKVDQDSRRRLGIALVKACMKANEAIAARLSGEAVDTPEAPPPTAATAPTPQQSALTSPRATLQDLYEYWKGQGDAKKPKTLHEASSACSALQEVAGPVPPAGVTKQHVVALRDKLIQKGNSPATLKKKLGLLSAMFQVAFEDDQFGLTRNPCEGVAVRGKQGETKQRAPFTIEELQRIFSSPVYTKGFRTEGMKGEAAYWLPLLALFTGARLNELGQLRVEDVKRSEGIDYLHITDLGEGQSLKKGSKNWRRVPLHRELLRLGFVQYVEDMRKAGHQMLFQLTPDSHDHLTGNWSKRWNDYLDDVVGIDDNRKDFHSFRHGFKAFSRLAGIAEDRHDALTGHANASVARKYGSADGYPLVPLRQAIDALKFPGLDLRAVRPYKPVS